MNRIVYFFGMCRGELVGVFFGEFIGNLCVMIKYVGLVKILVIRF